MEWSRAKANRVLPRQGTGHNKHFLPTTQEKTLHMDITRWSTPKSDLLYLLATEWNTNTAAWFESLYFNTRFLQLLFFISLAQQPTGQVAKHYDSETIPCAGAGRDNLYLDLFTVAKTVLGNFLINLESVLSLDLFLLRNQRNILVCKKCSFPTGTEDS